MDVRREVTTILQCRSDVRGDRVQAAGISWSPGPPSVGQSRVFPSACQPVSLSTCRRLPAPEDMAEPLHAVKHYQRVLERSQHDHKRMLRCIEKLYHLPVTVQLLQDTGVGRTVNALRKGEGEVATAARTVIAKWKQMVADEEEEIENQQAEYNENHQNSPPPSTDNDRVSEKSYRSSSSRHERDDDYKKSTSHREEEENDLRQREKKREKQRIEDKSDKKPNYSREKEYERSHSPKVESPNASDDNNDSEEEEHELKANDNDRVETASGNEDYHDYGSDREERGNQKSLSDDESEPESPPAKKSSHKSSKDSNSHSSSSSKNKHSHHREKSEKHKSKHKSSSNDSSSSKSSSRDRSEKTKSNDDSRKASDSHDKHSRGSSSQIVDLHRKYEKLDEKERLLEKERKSDSKEKRSKESDKADKDQSGSSSRSKHSSSKDGHSHHSERSKHHKDKHSDKDRHSSDKNKKSSDKHKSHNEKSTSSDHDTVVKKDSRDSSESRKKESRDETKRERSKHSLPKDNNSKSDLKQKHRDSPECAPESKKRKMINQTGDGIDGGSGASFAEALGMISPSKSSISSKKKSASGSKLMSESSESPNDTSYKQNSKEDATPSLLQTSSKLAPLAPLTVSISALPDISPNYVPRPPPKLIDNPFPSISEEEALNVVMNTKNQRTKVFSGNKTVHGCMPSLYELCVTVLQENISALEYTGGVPYEIIKPVVDKATPDQLFTLEHFNPYLIEDTDPLWQSHCSKRFRNKQRQEMESWREMYMRCCDEQEAKLKSLTANIKLSQDKSLPVRQTKMAYVDSIVKPPRNIARKQAIHGTARKAVASPAARVAALANSTVFNAASAVGVGSSSSTQPVRTSTFIKPKKAPLMQKALQLIKGRYKR
ncbi:uncharacterized protein LOC143910440 [Arctopsyche grandis]|uniref:uncharacterized protein LOC143910440 n=1 Tax=Arctopsyche grandis TaxID=121162 RepID=UPI00406D8065